MSEFWQWLGSVQYEQPHLIKSLMAGTMVSMVCGVVGCFIVLRRTSFLADALAHSMLAGVVGGYLLMSVAFNADAGAAAMLIGALIAGLITVALVGFVSKYSRLKDDAVIGIMYTGVFALGGVLASIFSHRIHIDLYHFVVGDVLSIGERDLWTMAIVASLVLTVVVVFFRQLQLISFDRVMAAAIGIPVLLMDYLLTTCVSVVVVIGVNLVGVILVVALLITPAGTAYLLTDRLKRMLWLSALFGCTSFWGGYWLSVWFNVAPGSAVVVTGFAQFSLVFVLAPRYGLLAEWLRKMRSVPQTLIEDVLGCILRGQGNRSTLAAISQLVPGRSDQIRRALRLLERQRMITRTGAEVSLTVSGEREAKRLLRAHRLWETYLEQQGTPATELHERAHRLEHLHDEQAVDYLDDKLGHPLRDPHGAEIPEDFVHLVPGNEIPAGLLRDGHRATVLQVRGRAANTGLEPGMVILARAREDEDRIWSFEAEGRQFRLDHEQADAVLVRLEA